MSYSGVHSVCGFTEEKWDEAARLASEAFQGTGICNRLWAWEWNVPLHYFLGINVGWPTDFPKVTEDVPSFKKELQAAIGYLDGVVVLGGAFVPDRDHLRRLNGAILYCPGVKDRTELWELVVENFGLFYQDK